MMHGREKSDPATVAMKPANKVVLAAAELVERRAGAGGNARQQSTRRTQTRAHVTHALDRVRQAAKLRKKERLTALLHHVSVDTRQTAFYALKRKAAPGVDGMTWQEYETGLELRLEALHDRIHRGAYRPQPARRTYIPKADGRQRPLAIAPWKTRLSRGRRHGAEPSRNSRFPGRNPGGHTPSPLDRQQFVEHRVGDKRIVRLIRKWLKAGILEDGTVTVSDRGTGQGSVISPLLANIYLHYVLDLWAERWRRHEATGDMIIVRYADDVVVGFEREADANRFLEAIRTRFVEFALSLHPDKTRLMEFGRLAAARRRRRGLGKPETFTFLGFTFICGKSRGGKFLLKRKSRSDRVQAKLAEVKEELRHRRHQPIPEQGKWLAHVVTGFFNYHAVPTNFAALQAFRDHVRDLWRRSLRRRSQRDNTTYAGQARARAEGKRFGRKPVLDGEQRQKALQRLAEGASISVVAREMKASRATVMRVGRAGPAAPLR